MVHSADIYSANVAHTLVDFRVVVGIRLVDGLPLEAFHDGTLEVQHLVHTLAVHTEASQVDSYSVDILDLKIVSAVCVTNNL